MAAPKPREPTYHAHTPEQNVTAWLQRHAGACEACGRTRPRVYLDLFCVRRPGSGADREQRRYERLCAGCAATAEIRRRWAAGALLGPVRLEDATPAKRHELWARVAAQAPSPGGDAS